MGKVRKHKPQRSAIVEETAEEEIPIDSKENAIQTILDQLQTATVEEKFCGLQTFAQLIEGPENVEAVLTGGIVRSAAPLLLDNVNSIRNAASGAIRNLSAGGHDICDRLMEQDVMTPLICYFHQFAEKWVPDVNIKDSDTSETVINCINLLWNLCESSELAVKYLEQSRILDILPRYLDLPVFGADIVASVLQCLLVVVEDNPQAIDKIKSNSEHKLQQILSIEGREPDQLLIKTLAAGVTINLCGGNIVSLPSVVVTRLMLILQETLAEDHRQICHSLSSDIPIRDRSGKIAVPKGKEALILENKIKSVATLLDAQQSSVEIIANLCSSTECDDSVNESSESEEMADDEIENGDSDINESVYVEDKLPPEVMEAMVALEIFDKVWAKTQLPAENVMLILLEFDRSISIHKKLYNLQTNALLCISNMLSSLPVYNMKGKDGLYKIWVDAGKLVFKPRTPENTNILESAATVMRAAIDEIKNITMHDEKVNVLSDLTISDIEIMVNGTKECTVPEVRASLLRMLGILALIIVCTSRDVINPVTVSIAEFLLDQAHREQSVGLVAEIVDTLVDLFSHDKTDELASRVKLVERLKDVSHILKNKARQQKKLSPEIKSLVSTAVTNLPGFIKYKSSRCRLIK